MFERIAALGLGYLASAYASDVLLGPCRMAERARYEADSRGKPMLNVGAGTQGSSLRAILFGPQLVGDVNLDLNAPVGTPGPNRVVYGDMENIPYPDKYFGSALASHVLEHVNDPERAVSEMCRTADRAFFVVPKWWCPHTWIHPGHRWFIGQDGGISPLWS